MVFLNCNRNLQMKRRKRKNVNNVPCTTTGKWLARCSCAVSQWWRFRGLRTRFGTEAVLACVSRLAILVKSAISKFKSDLPDETILASNFRNIVKMTISTSLKSLEWPQFILGCNDCRHSFFHWFQNSLARWWTLRHTFLNTDLHVGSHLVGLKWSCTSWWGGDGLASGSHACQENSWYLQSVVGN